jgi:hypothetical protein
MAEEVTGTAQILGEQRTMMLEQSAIRLGINCTACGLEMSGPGFEFVSLRPTFKDGRPTVIEGHAFICHREECAVARQEARDRATAVRPAGGWEVITAGSDSIGEHDESDDDGGA